jgi:hypothetical protein
VDRDAKKPVACFAFPILYLFRHNDTDDVDGMNPKPKRKHHAFRQQAAQLKRPDSGS